jgi:soluble lytic murein transglycosylase-like protein
MNQPGTTRKFEQRFLDHTDRRITQTARKGRLASLRRRYAPLILGATLAVGGLGIPMKLAKAPQQNAGEKHEQTQSSPVLQQLASDLQTAQSIAREVTGGVESAAGTIAEPLAALETVEQDVNQIAEKAREEFFKKEVPFGSLIYKEAKKNNLKPELVAAVVQTESRFKPNARSHVGAQGLMQLMPKTGRWMGARQLSDPHQNVQAGTKYLKYLNERFDGNETKVIAAYNAGEGNVRRFGGVPPFKETRNYVKKVRTAENEFASQMAEHVAAVVAGGASDAITR